jgi:hypothetical protein
MPDYSAADANQHPKVRTKLGLYYDFSTEDMKSKSFIQTWLKLETEKGWLQ